MTAPMRTMATNKRTVALRAPRADLLPGRYRRQSGLALVIVIWILTLLTLMAGSFAMTMRRESSVSNAIQANARALALAESGIILAEFHLQQPDARRRWLANGTVYQILRGDEAIRIRIFAESGKVDINTAGEAQLSALLQWAIGNDGFEQQRLLNAILDWRDADDETRMQGAERRQYRLAGRSYGPSNTAFQTLEELQLVLGMHPALFERMRPYLTVYSGAAELDVRNAAPELLDILASGLKQQNIRDQALENRLDEEEDGDEAEAAPLGENQTYTIIAEALLPDRASAALETVAQTQDIDDGESAFAVLDWRANLQGQSLFDEAMDYAVINVQDEFRYSD